MINTRIVALMAGLCLPLMGLAQHTAKIKVSVNDIKSAGKGEVVFMLFNTSDGFPKERNKAFKYHAVSDFGNSATYTFTDVPYGEYAISVHQDKDANGEMKSNFIGMPKEPVGASNLTKMGKPNFEKCKFLVDDPAEEINIKFIIANSP